MHKLIYAGIGSRETPTGVQQTMYRIGMVLAMNGWTLRSGHADGADIAFEKGAIQGKGKMEIYLPWDGFNGARHDGVSYFSGFNTTEHEVKAIRIAAHFHPGWANCTDGARKMHTRNVQQVGGRDLDTAINMIICWTKDGKGGGGTGQAIRIAKHYDIPVFDLAIHTEKQVQDFINEGKRP